MSNVKIPMSNGRGGRVEDSRGKIQGSMLKRGATQGDCLANPSTLSLFSPFTLAKCETSWALHRVINLMAHGLHNWALSRVFPEVYRSLELGNLGSSNSPKLRDVARQPPPCALQICRQFDNTLPDARAGRRLASAQHFAHGAYKIREIREIRGSDQHPDFSNFSYFSHPGRTTDGTARLVAATKSS
jgi:hypothetical protein